MTNMQDKVLKTLDTLCAQNKVSFVWNTKLAANHGVFYVQDELTTLVAGTMDFQAEYLSLEYTTPLPGTIQSQRRTWRANYRTKDDLVNLVNQFSDIVQVLAPLSV